MYCIVFLIQLLVREGGEERVEKYYLVLNVECEDANMNRLQDFKL